jgi:hypothetical protein
LWPNFLVGNVKLLPIPSVGEALAAALADRVRSGVDDRRQIYRHLEPFREFTAPQENPGSLEWEAGSLLGEELENRVAAAYGLNMQQAQRLELDMQEALAALGMSDPARDEDDDELGDIPQWEERLLSYLVGVAFGRWDVRIAQDPTLGPALRDPFDPPSATPPGILVENSGWPTAVAPPDYPLALPSDGLLFDEPGHRWDIETQVFAAASCLFQNGKDECARLVVKLGRTTLREYLRRQFFKDHLSVYSKGRRRAPIYWPLTVPSGRWGVWVYTPKLCREMLYRIAAEVVRRERLAEIEISRLEREQAGNPAGRGMKVLNRALDEERTLAEELRCFREEIERIAGLGWEPDLDDGVVLCAAPLADLFPVWKGLSQYRDELRSGKYEWSSVSKWADQL